MADAPSGSVWFGLLVGPSSSWIVLLISTSKVHRHLSTQPVPCSSTPTRVRKKKGGKIDTSAGIAVTYTLILTYSLESPRLFRCFPRSFAEPSIYVRQLELLMRHTYLCRLYTIILCMELRPSITSFTRKKKYLIKKNRSPSFNYWIGTQDRSRDKKFALNNLGNAPTVIFFLHTTHPPFIHFPLLTCFSFFNIHVQFVSRTIHTNCLVIVR